jgi:hypothetical protein
MLSRFLNILLISTLCTFVIDKTMMPMVVTVYVCSGLLSALYTTLLITRIRRLKEPHVGLVPIINNSDLKPQYHQRVILARTVSLILLVKVISWEMYMLIPYVIIQYIILEYYIYLTRILSTVSIELIERHYE